IVPIFKDGSLLMVENYRHGVGQNLLELPGGFINPGETPTHAAGRELLEETGYTAPVLKEISFHYTWPGRCTQRNYVFRARGLYKHSSQTLDTLETIKILKLSKRRVFREIREGMIKSAATISAIFLAYIGQMDKNNYSNEHD
ncbi:MAG TPA: NUDIX hydrolase, partial [Nitrososphaeraceae archaeon]|nr:NUDIX hydrolase [Nitrososphaeraceae archaeon]